MTFYEELKTKYGINKPILLRDITYKGYSVVRHIRWSRIRQIKRSCLMVS